MHVSARSQYRVREARRGDLPHLRRIERAATPSAWPTRVLLQYLMRPDTVARVVVSRSDDEVPVGFFIAMLEEGDLYLANLAVAPAWRRRGVASFALGELDGLAKRLGYSSLLLDVKEENLGAQLLYRKHGFRAFEVKRRHYGEQDAYRMRKELAEVQRSRR